MTKELPHCPEQCGGPTAGCCDELDSSYRAIRAKYGCDRPAPHARYAITCPECHGSGLSGCEACAECKGEGRKLMYRCPASFQTPDVSEALRALAWVERGFLPVEGGIVAQDRSFLWFVDAFKAELAAGEREEREELERSGR